MPKAIGEPLEKPRILLVNPPITDSADASQEGSPPPLGIAYIAAVLEQHGFEVGMLDAYTEGYEHAEIVAPGMRRTGLPETEIIKKFREFKPKIVGVSCIYSAFARDAFRMAELAKRELPDALVCFGGAHASYFPEDVLKHRDADIVVCGEGELTFLEIAERVSKGKSISDVAGTVVRKSSKAAGNASGRAASSAIARNKPRQLMPNLDELPLPARHLMPIEKHLANKTAYPFAKRRPVLEIITSRGCPGKCVFCGIHAIWGNTWRPRSAKKVVDEMELLIKQYGVREFSIMDDNVSADPKRFEEILDEILRRRLDITWETPNGIALWTLNENLLKKMKQSGYYRAKFGIESGCGTTLRYIGKPINLEKARRIIEACNRLGIWTSSSFIIGFPDEGAKSVEETINFAIDSGLDFARVLIAQPYAGTKLYADFKSAGLLDSGLKEKSSCFVTLYNTKHFTAEQLNSLRREAEARFLRAKVKAYLTPSGFARFVWPKIKSLNGLSYFARSAFTVARAKLMGRFL